MFPLEVLDGSVRYFPITANMQYLSVSAGQGGMVTFTVAGYRYQAHIEPPEKGYLTVAAK